MAVGSAQAASEGPKLGQPANPQDIAAWRLTVFPDGKGLPTGAGTVDEGKLIYQQRCASCHGADGAGGSANELAGARHGLADATPDKTIGSYWPYATTLFDFVRRAMPLDKPGSLDNNQTYAVCAYLLHLNGIVPANATLDAAALAAVKMPNRDGFTRIDAR
ncbi:MAG: c-type cytochrome [Candidatus Methylumidiphilus sp.]